MSCLRKNQLPFGTNTSIPEPELLCIKMARNNGGKSAQIWVDSKAPVDNLYPFELADSIQTLSDVLSTWLYIFMNTIPHYAKNRWI